MSLDVQRLDVLGLDVRTGAPIRVRAGDTIVSVEPIAESDGCYIAPGWIDIQINGFAGVDYNAPSTPHADIARSIDVLLSTGVTRACPTVITGSPHDMRAALANLADARDTLPLGTVIDGLHVEGPHISPDDGPRGAHPRRWVRAPDIDEFHRWQDAARGRIRMVTLAPEWPGATRYIEALVRAGVAAAIGHTGASARQIADAVEAGATVSTHLGNAAHGTLARHPNYIWDQLADDRLSASFIVDGLHLPAAFLTVAIRAKGIARAMLVTDASAPACSRPGRYRLGEQDVELDADGRVVLAGGHRLAGSSLRMDQAVERVMRLAGVSLAEAVTMATTNPARAARLPGRQRGLVPGERADLVRFRVDTASGAIQVEETYVSGRCTFRRNSAERCHGSPRDVGLE